MPPIKCPYCHKLLAKGQGRIEIKCPKCKRVFYFDTDKGNVAVEVEQTK